MSNTINSLTARQANQVVKRAKEDKKSFPGSKGKFVTSTAVKIANGTATKKEISEFEGYSDYISLCFM